MFSDVRKLAIQAGVHTEKATAADVTPAQVLERNFAEHYEALYRFLRSCGAGDSAAEDSSQEAFLRLYEQFVKLRPPQNTRAWLFRVAYRVWIDRWREARREVAGEASWEFWSDFLPDPAAGAEEELLARERREWLRKALGQLSQIERQALHLRADGLRYRDVAEVLGVTYWSAVEAVRRALDILGEELHGL